MLLSYQDPFEEYKTRLAKKLAKRAENTKPGTSVTQEKKEEVNWFGTKIGSDATALDFGGKTGAGAGVGKYLNLKRPQASVASSRGDDSKKKRKIGFGEFEGW